MKKVFLILLSVFIVYSSCEDGINDSGYRNNESTESYRPGTGSGNAGDSWNDEKYNVIEENPFLSATKSPVSTFSIDADGASYSNVRRYISQGYTPPKDAIRTEEMINYFMFDYPEPLKNHAVGINTEITECPWEENHKIMKIGIKGKSITKEKLPAANLVLLVDVSGSMSMDGKLDLLKQSLALLIDNLREQDRIAIVTYAGTVGVALGSTSGVKKDSILKVIQNLEAAGSTAGAQGIQTAYSIASENFIEKGNNRVILATDGDFNVGPSSQEELVTLIKEKRETGIKLTILGVGKDNLNDALMEQTANNGDGTYEYIDSYEQANKIFNVEYGKFYSVAGDVKIQVEFNQSAVESYRLIGYENRLLDNSDFDDDNKDAGEIGAGQSITALYELKTKISDQDQLANVSIKYKDTEEEISKSINSEVFINDLAFDKASEDLRFAASIAAFSLKLRKSAYSGNSSYQEILNWANSSRTYDPNNFRKSFVDMLILYNSMEHDNSRTE